MIALYQREDDSGMIVLDVYQRINNMWVRDDEKTSLKEEDIGFLLCNDRERCLTMKDECKKMSDVKELLKKDITKRIIDEFEESFQINRDQIKKSIYDSYEYNYEMIDQIKKLKKNELVSSSKRNILGELLQRISRCISI